MSSRLAIFMNVPGAFRPKAEYALRALCSGRRVEPVFVSRQQVLNKGGILYEKPGGPFPASASPVVRIPFDEEAAQYFESGKKLPEPGTIEVQQADRRDVPVLFGRQFPRSRPDLEADIAASAFFWLSDWQQRVIKERDEHGRVPFRKTLQARYGWAERPLVDEYADYLFEALERVGMSIDRKKWGNRDFAFALTYDMDNIRSSAWGRLARALWSARTNSIQRAVRLLSTGTDPVQQSIDKLLEFTGAMDIRPTVFLKAAGGHGKNDARDYLFHPYFQTLMHRLHDLNAAFGVHPGYRAGHDPLLAAAEKLRLEQALRVGPITTHRAHYLRHDGMKAACIWEEEGYEADSSIAWAEHTGFRTGTCRPHPVYDHEHNRPSRVIEWPMCAMDAQLEGYMGLKQEAALRRLNKLTDTVERHGGVMVWNFHQTVYLDDGKRQTAAYFEPAVREVLGRQPLAETISQLSQWI